MEDRSYHCYAWLSHYIGEIIFLLFKSSEELLNLSSRLFIYQETCLKDYDEEICANLTEYRDIELSVQHAAAGG